MREELDELSERCEQVEVQVRLHRRVVDGHVRMKTVVTKLSLHMLVYHSETDFAVVEPALDQFEDYWRTTSCIRELCSFFIIVFLSLLSC